MDALEREYSPSSRVGGSAEPFVADYVRRSQAARSVLGDDIVAFAGSSLLVAPDHSAPLLVFIHGGYWQALSAEASLYLAPGALANGWSCAALEYTLAPAASLPQMIAECTAALGALVSLVSPSRVVLAGHSAGAHLAAMTSIAAPSPLTIDRTVLVSGVFDLRPLVHTTVNDPLGLDDAAAAALSPQLLPVVGSQQVVVAWGDDETDAFKWQSRQYVSHLERAGRAVSSIECAPRHHFDIVDDLVDPGSPLGRLTMGALA